MHASVLARLLLLPAAAPKTSERLLGFSQDAFLAKQPTIVTHMVDGAWAAALGWWRHRRRALAAPTEPPEQPSETMPYWNLLLAQLLFSIPYFFGSIAKLNEDWLLRAQPLHMWLAPGSRHVSWVPFGLGSHWLFPWFIAWGGFGFDLTIVFPGPKTITPITGGIVMLRSSPVHKACTVACGGSTCTDGIVT